MKRNLRTLLAVAVAALVLSATAWAQAKPDAKSGDTTPAAKPAAATPAATAPAAAKPEAAKPDAVEKPKIQMAVLLDTSNSMDGLIGQARTQLWKIVNEFA